jgi:hypothetical protein
LAIGTVIYAKTNLKSIAFQLPLFADKLKKSPKYVFIELVPDGLDSPVSGQRIEGARQQLPGDNLINQFSSVIYNLIEVT